LERTRREGDHEQLWVGAYGMFRYSDDTTTLRSFLKCVPPAR
jgi:hypothetical protein